MQEHRPEIEVNRVRRVTRTDVQPGRLTVGRASDNDVVLQLRTVSRHHCVIETTEDGSRVRDLDSHYGTTVNGERVDERALVHGDVIGVAGFEITFTEGPAERRPEDGAADTGASGEREDEQAARAEALDEREAALDRARAELDERRAALDERDRELDARSAAVADRETAFAAAETTRQESLASERATLTAEVAARAAALEEREAALEEREAALEEREAALEAAEAARSTEAERAQTEAHDRIAHLEAALDERSAADEQRRAEAEALRAELARVRHDLETRTSLLDDATRDMTALRAHLDDASRARTDAGARADLIERELDDLRRALDPLVATAHRATEIEEALPDLEQRFLAADARVDTIDADEQPEALEAATVAREEAAAALERAHATLNETMSALRGDVERFRAHTAEAPAPAVQGKGRRRRWSSSFRLLAVTGIIATGVLAGLFVIQQITRG